MYIFILPRNLYQKDYHICTVLKVDTFPILKSLKTANTPLPFLEGGGGGGGGLIGRGRWDLNPFVSDFSQHVGHMCTQHHHGTVGFPHFFPSNDSALFLASQGIFFYLFFIVMRKKAMHPTPEDVEANSPLF
jgi:hypothetical protein